MNRDYLWYDGSKTSYRGLMYYFHKYKMPTSIFTDVGIFCFSFKKNLILQDQTKQYQKLKQRLNLNLTRLML
jgi:hypothetical protein